MTTFDIDGLLNDIPTAGDSIRLTYNELCMLDQVIFDNPSEDGDGWYDFRLDIWEVIYQTQVCELTATLPSHGLNLVMPEDLQSAFMFLIPTTKMYGGEDAAHSLKFKIACKLLGHYEDPQIQQDIDDEEVKKEEERLAKEKEDATKASDQAQGSTSDET